MLENDWTRVHSCGVRGLGDGLGLGEWLGVGLALGELLGVGLVLGDGLGLVDGLGLDDAAELGGGAGLGVGAGVLLGWTGVLLAVVLGEEVLVGLELVLTMAASSCVVLGIVAHGPLETCFALLTASAWL